MSYQNNKSVLVSLSSSRRFSQASVDMTEVCVLSPPPEPKERCDVRDSSCPGVLMFRLGVQFTKSDISKSENGS